MWVVYTFLTIISYAALDFFIKRMAGKINDFLGIIILTATAILPALIFLFILQFPSKKILITSNGVFFAVAGGIALGVGTLSFLKLFDGGINLSLASPLVRIGILIVTTSLGLLVLKEVVTIKEWIGLAFAAFGLIMLMFK